MATWEFFLQNVGEADWLRLDTPQPELPTGRYAVAARAQHRPHELIEVELTTRDTADAIAREAQYQRSCQLDEQGFGILIPQIKLTPGIWEIQCRADLLDALLENDWAITLLLEVREELEAAASQFQQPADRNVPIEEDSQQSRLSAEADQMLDNAATELSPQGGNHTAHLASVYSLQLDQEQLRGDLSKPIVVSGQVIAHQDGPHPALRLMIGLRDPRTGHLIAELFPRLPDSPFPLTFCYSLTVVSSCASYLLEGEVILCQDKLQDQAQIFDRQQFSVTASWENLQSFLTIASETKCYPSSAPLSPLLAEDTLSSGRSHKGQRVLPPRLLAKRNHRDNKPSPRLPILPKSSQPALSRNYGQSKPVAETSTAY